MSIFNYQWPRSSNKFIKYYGHFPYILSRFNILRPTGKSMINDSEWETNVTSINLLDKSSRKMLTVVRLHSEVAFPWSQLKHADFLNGTIIKFKKKYAFGICTHLFIGIFVRLISITMFTVRITKNQQQNKFTFKNEPARQDVEYLPRWMNICHWWMPSFWSSDCFLICRCCNPLKPL